MASRRVESAPAPLWVAATACAALGSAATIGTGAALAGDLGAALVAALLGGVALVVILALRWVDSLGPFALCLPLPALYATGDVRIPTALVAALVVVTGWGLSRGLSRHPLAAHASSARSLAFLVMAVLLASLFAQERVAAARESLNFVLLLGVFLFAMDEVGRSSDRADVFARWLAWGAALAGGAAVLETVGVLPGRFPLAGTGLFRAAGGFGWPNELAMFLVISLPISIYALRVARSSGGRLLAASGVLAVVLGLAMTFSRGSWLAAASAPVVLVLAREGKLAFRFWGLAVLAGLVIDLGSGGALSARVAGTTGDALVGQRLLLTGAGLLMFQASPIVGVGPGGFGDALEAFGPQISGLFEFVGSAHNGYVHVAAETGIIGLTALVYFVASTLSALVRAAREPGFATAEGLDGAPRTRVDRTSTHRDRAFRVALLWSFATACIVSLFEWPFAHGIGQLIVMVAALGRTKVLPATAVR